MLSSRPILRLHLVGTDLLRGDDNRGVDLEWCVFPLDYRNYIFRVLAYELPQVETVALALAVLEIDPQLYPDCFLLKIFIFPALTLRAESPKTPKLFRANHIL